MKNFNSFIKENSNYPNIIDLESLSNKMKIESDKKWFDKLDELILNKVIKFRGSKWSEPGHTWKDFVITVKKIDSDRSTAFSSEFTVIDTNGEYYTLISATPIKIYDNLNDYDTEVNSEKYNL